MHRFAVLVAITLVGSVPALGFDADSQAVIDHLKVGKHLPIASIATLMRGSERWCYNLRDGNCAWSDIYLDVTDTGAKYEISNPWNEKVDISSVDQGVFKEGRYICETSFDWVPSVRAFDRESGSAIEGRALETLRQEISAAVDTSQSADCFDYVYRGADADEQTVTLLQRQYVDGVTDPANDAEVTLYFDKDAAEALGWYW